MYVLFWILLTNWRFIEIWPNYELRGICVFRIPQMILKHRKTRPPSPYHWLFSVLTSPDHWFSFLASPRLGHQFFNPGLFKPRSLALHHWPHQDSCITGSLSMDSSRSRVKECFLPSLYYSNSNLCKLMGNEETDFHTETMILNILTWKALVHWNWQTQECCFFRVKAGFHFSETNVLLVLSCQHKPLFIRYCTTNIEIRSLSYITQVYYMILGRPKNQTLAYIYINTYPHLSISVSILEMQCWL